jgi:aromatic ring-opening dioxygenase catalytic subunit (LigB family)
VLTDLLKKGFATLVISHHDPSFVVNDSLDHTQFFQTTGTSDEHDLISTKVASTTHWEGSRLVTEYDLSSSRKLMYTYSLLPATRQMVLRVRLEGDLGQRATGPEIKLVYAQSASHE